MSRSTVWTLLAGLLLAGSFAAGWHAKGVSGEAAAARAARDALHEVAADVNQQIVNHTAQLQAQQDKSTALFAQQQLVRTRGESIRLEITHAVFSPAEPLGIAASCPDPSGAAEFERLYDAAAKGGSAAHTGSAGTGGVP